MKFFKAFIVLFLLNLSLDIFFNNAEGLSQCRIVTKPLITILLGVFFYLNSSEIKFQKRLIILGALTALCIGDIFLLETMPFYSFMTGLSLFLGSILLYSLYFYKQTLYNIDRLIPFLAVSLLISLALFYFMFEKLNNLLIPVMIYMATVLNFLKLAYLRYKNVNLKSYRLVFIGVSCFTVAQIIIGLNQFCEAVPYKDIYIMLFYGTSQLLIILGILMMKNHITNKEDRFLV
ncbi:YhhN family protein [Kordia sp. SMS9]|uniref:lysoplasmalogenase n=1 Tax=Kordia sp. SMS9 TaxID=2282170 RepID=UPI000E0DA21B|nr:lysoplasmalogenase [Kordia sp. SMS9]AXG70495.1 YhhN family protein [Kordia sp. SMS9]